MRTLNKAEPSNDSSFCDRHSERDNIPSFVEVTISAHGNEKYLFEIEVSLLFKLDEAITNKSIGSRVVHL